MMKLNDPRVDLINQRLKFLGEWVEGDEDEIGIDVKIIPIIRESLWRLFEYNYNIPAPDICITQNVGTAQLEWVDILKDVVFEINSEELCVILIPCKYLQRIKNGGVEQATNDLFELFKKYVIRE